MKIFRNDKRSLCSLKTAFNFSTHSTRQNACKSNKINEWAQKWCSAKKMFLWLTFSLYFPHIVYYDKVELVLHIDYTCLKRDQIKMFDHEKNWLSWVSIFAVFFSVHMNKIPACHLTNTMTKMCSKEREQMKYREWKNKNQRINLVNEMQRKAEREKNLIIIGIYILKHFVSFIFTLTSVCLSGLIVFVDVFSFEMKQCSSAHSYRNRHIAILRIFSHHTQPGD